MSQVSGITQKAAAMKERLTSDNVRYASNKWARKAKDLILGFCVILIFLGTSYIIISPLIGVMAGTFKDYVDLANPMIFLIPETFTLENIEWAMYFMNYLPTLGITMVYATGLALIHVFVGAMVGYGFARFNIPGRGILFALLLATIIMPAQIYILPMTQQFRNFFGFNILNSFVPMILITATGMGLRSGLFIYIFRQFFRGLPKEIEEAALIDGAGIFRTFVKVMLPNAMPPIITVLLFAFVWQYNDTFYAAMLVGANNPLMPFNLLAIEYGAMFNMVNFGGRTTMIIPLFMYAGVALAIAPVLFIYFLLQRHFIEGIERSGIVG